MRQIIIADGDGEEYKGGEISLVHLWPILFLFANKPATKIVRTKHVFLETKQPVLEDSMLFAGAWVINWEVAHLNIE